MAKIKKSRKKRSKFKSFFTWLLIILIIILSYALFTRIVLPVFNKYIKKPIVIEGKPPQEEKREPTIIIEEEEMVELNLYFSDVDAMYLVAERRKIAKTENLAKQVVNELIKGSNNANLYPTIPEQTKINEVYIADDIAYIDLSEDIIKNHSGGSSSELMTLYSIVNSLTEIPPIKGVQILIEGKQRESLTGHIDISMPFLRDEDWIKP